MEPAHPLHPLAVHALIQALLAVVGYRMASVPAPSTRQPKRRNTALHHVAFVKKIPEDDRPNDHPPPCSLVQ